MLLLARSHSTTAVSKDARNERRQLVLQHRLRFLEFQVRLVGR